MTTVATYNVSGMTCGHCEKAVAEELAKLPGVRKVEVELASGDVTVTSDEPLADGDVAGAVDEAGYELTAQGGGR